VARADAFRLATTDITFPLELYSSGVDENVIWFLSLFIFMLTADAAVFFARWRPTIILLDVFFCDKLRSRYLKVPS